MKNLKLILLLVLNYNYVSYSQQIADTTFVFDIGNPYNKSDDAPVIYIDALHNNLHKLDGNFAPFAKLARADGYNVESLNRWEDLENAHLLVIANALNEQNIGNWERPIYSAFTQVEIDKIVRYVENGGSLLLIADHMPFAGAASSLAKSFGFELCDGFAQLDKKGNVPDTFSEENKRLKPSILTNGLIGEEVSKVITFTGSSFSIPNDAIGILKFLENDTCAKPNVAWQFDDTTPKISLGNEFQGAIKLHGKGKIAIFGEAAMFTAQTVTQNGNTFKVGYNSSYATENIQFIRNVLLWLNNGIESITQTDIVSKEILSVNKQMEETFNAKKFSSVGEFYANDGIMVGGNNIEVLGKENLVEYWSRFSGDLTWEIKNIEIKSIGVNTALQRGYSIVHYKKKDGTGGISKSIFSLVWIKEGGEWKIMLDHFSGR